MATATVPELPNTEGPHAPVAQAVAVAVKTDMFNNGANVPVSAAEVLNIMQQATSAHHSVAYKLNQAANNRAIGAKMQEVKDLQKQIEGEQKSAITKFAVSIAAAGVTAIVPIAGAKMTKGPGATDPGGSPTGVTPQPPVNSYSAKPPIPPTSATNISQSASGAGKPLDPTKAGKAAAANGNQPTSGVPGTPAPTDPADLLKAKMDAHGSDVAGALGQPLGQVLGDVVTKAGDLGDKLGGGQHDADMAKVAQKIDTVNSQIAQVAVDSTKALMDQALGHIKDAQTAIQGFAQRKMEVDNNTAAR